MERRIDTLSVNNEEAIKRIRANFGLNEDPYLDMDSNLILLAFIPDCTHYQGKGRTTLINKFGVCDHQTLEFYGDKVLSYVIVMLLYEFFGLTENPGLYTRLFSDFTNNRLLTDVMLSKDACQLVRSRPYTIKDQKKFHNQCADTLEALIGAIFVHLKDKNTDYLALITKWLLKNTILGYSIKQTLSKMGYSSIPVYIINDRKTLRENWIQGYQTLKDELLSNKETMNPSRFDYLSSAYTTAQNVKDDDFSETAIIVNYGTSIEDIFKLLGWNYDGIVTKDDLYNIYGYPGFSHTIIGSGNNPDEAQDNAVKYLLSRGYIVYNKILAPVFNVQESQVSTGILIDIPSSQTSSIQSTVQMPTVQAIVQSTVQIPTIQQTVQSRKFKSRTISKTYAPVSKPQVIPQITPNIPQIASQQKPIEYKLSATAKVYIPKK